MDYNYDYSFESAPPDATTAVATAVIVGMLLFFLFIFIIVAYAVTAFLLGRIFKKAGIQQWAAWVPVYNIWKTLELGGQPGFWAILSLLPFVNIVAWIFIYIAMYHIGKKLNKDDWFVILAIFLPIVWLLWLAFDDSKWHGDKSAKASDTDDTIAAKAKKPAKPRASKKTSEKDF